MGVHPSFLVSTRTFHQVGESLQKLSGETGKALTMFDRAMSLAGEALQLAEMGVQDLPDQTFPSRGGIDSDSSCMLSTNLPLAAHLPQGSKVEDVPMCDLLVKSDVKREAPTKSAQKSCRIRLKGTHDGQQIPVQCASAKIKSAPQGRTKFRYLSMWMQARNKAARELGYSDINDGGCSFGSKMQHDKVQQYYMQMKQQVPVKGPVKGELFN